MFEIEFYENKQGRQPVKEILLELRDRALKSKDARIQYHKILAHLRALESYGTRIGEPQVKYIDDGLWELRPLAHRILFFYWQDNKFILLHHFVKKTQKTPLQEIEQAKQYMKDYLERND